MKQPAFALCVVLSIARAVGTSSAQEPVAPAASGSTGNAVVTCRPLAPIQLGPGDDTGVRSRIAGGPLSIVPQWDSSVTSSFGEPYTITSTTNKLALKINGLVISPITLTTGSRTAQQIADDLNAVALFLALADAKSWNGPNGYQPPNYLYIRSKGTTLGSIEVLNTTNSAHVALGLALGLRGPDANAARRVVFEQAFDDWESVILDGGNISSPYTARIAYSPAKPLGPVSSGVALYSSGMIVGGYFDFDSTETWFEDPTPGDDSEFNGPGSPPNAIDLLTMVRHEFGHALGFNGPDGLVDVTTTLATALSSTATTAIVVSTAGFLDVGTFRVDGEIISYTSKTSTLFLGLSRGAVPANHSPGALLVSDNVYDSTRLNIAVFDRAIHAHHLYHPDDLMVSFFGLGERTGITAYPTLAKISRGQNARVPLAVLDPDGSPTPDGRASFPWSTLAAAAAATPSGYPFLLTAGTYLETSLPASVTSAHDFLIARDAVPLVH